MNKKKPKVCEETVRNSILMTASTHSMETIHFPKTWDYILVDPNQARVATWESIFDLHSNRTKHLAGKYNFLVKFNRYWNN